MGPSPPVLTGHLEIAAVFWRSIHLFHHPSIHLVPWNDQRLSESLVTDHTGQLCYLSLLSPWKLGQVSPLNYVEWVKETPEPRNPATSIVCAFALHNLTASTHLPHWQTFWRASQFVLWQSLPMLSLFTWLATSMFSYLTYIPLWEVLCLGKPLWEIPLSTQNQAMRLSLPIPVINILHWCI